MSLSDIGIGTADFWNNENTDFGSNITHVVVNETELETGKINRVFSGTNTQRCTFHKRTILYERTPEGERQLAPAYLMHDIDSGIKKNDKIIVGTGTGSEWRVFNVLNRDEVFNFSELFVWGE